MAVIIKSWSNIKHDNTENIRLDTYSIFDFQISFELARAAAICLF